MTRRPVVRALLVSAAVAAAISLAGCDTDSIAPTGRAQAPLSDKMVAEFEAKQMDKGSPILVRLFKEEAEAEVWKQDRTGQFALLKTYPICRWSGDLGPKVKEGDRQAPEGFYTITPGHMNPNSNYYLAFNTGYPNAYDRSLGHTGSELMVHGDCSSRGCYAMTDEQIVEIYALARESFFGGQKSFQLQAYPFRMTPVNMAKHRNSPHMAFWKMIKVGYDHFEVSHQQPKVDVCEKRYVFDAATPENASRPISFSPAGKCPVYETNKEIASAVIERQRSDGAQYAELVRRGAPVVASRAGIDGGMNPVFLAKLNPISTGDSDSRGQLIIPAAATPGALPRTPNNPPVQTTLPKQQVEIASAEPPAAPEVAANAPSVAPQPKAGETPASRSGTVTGLLGGLFGGSKGATGPAETNGAAPAQPRPTMIARAKNAAVKVAHAATAAIKHKVESSRVASAAAAPQLRPRIDAEAPKTQTADASKPAPELRSAYSAPPSGGLLAGAQPVVPTGTFEGRWSGLR
ncbi:MAG: L,D-transpeptidase family protein [Pseudolabrys sp.]